jgi:hypothetical protein
MITPRRPLKPLSPEETEAIRAAAAEELTRNPPPPATPAQLAIAEQLLMPHVRRRMAERENAA